jgi:hypothetical protein
MHYEMPNISPFWILLMDIDKYLLQKKIDLRLDLPLEMDFSSL